MLHLPVPHVCPACGGPHRAARAELPAAADLRPYFATFLMVSGSGVTPLVCTGIFGSGAGVTASISSNTITGLALSSATTPYTFSVGKTGIYSLFAQMQFYQGDAGNPYVIVQVNGGDLANSNTVHGPSGTNNDMGTGVYWYGQINAGGTFSFRKSNGQGAYGFTGQNNFTILFVPTPNYRQPT
jgi:hypothetical protein